MPTDHVWIKASRPGKCAECAECGEQIEVGDRVLYAIESHTRPGGRKIYCESCGNEMEN